MKKGIVGIATIVMATLLSFCTVYGQNMDFVQGSFLWQEEEYLMGVAAETTCGKLNENFKSDVAVTNTEGEVLSDGDYVGTGAEVNAAGILTAVILGDVTGDGRITSTDYLQMKRVFSGLLQFDKAYTKAADVDADGKLTSTDYMKIKRTFQGTENLYEDMRINPYVSEYAYTDYDTSQYRMDRSRINIGVFDFTKAISDDAHMKAFKEEFGGDFVLLGSNSSAFYDMCEKYQVGFFAKGKNLSRYTFGNAAENLDPTSFTEFETKLADYTDNYSYLWGDDVFDEPVASYFDWMKGATERYQAKFTDRFIYFNLHPVALGGSGGGYLSLIHI